MLVKLLGGTGIIIGSIFIGNRFIASMKCRVDFLIEFNHDIILLKSRILEREKLFRAFRYVSNFSNYPDVWKSFIQLCDFGGVNFGIEETMKKFKDELNLNKNDVKIINMLAKGLGATDVDAQEKHIEYVSQMIATAADNAEHVFLRDCKLFRSASILLGFVMVILLL